jgi:hypothetical protein
VDTAVETGETPSVSDTNNSISDFRADIRQSFEEALVTFMNCKTIRLLAEGDLTLDHYYKSILREIYYCVRGDPQIELLATVYLRGKDHSSVKGLGQHAISKMGHEEVAPSDLIMLGEDVSRIPSLRPLPTTMGLISFALLQSHLL